MILANLFYFIFFFFNSFWFTCPIEFTLAVHTEVCSWMICKACSWIYLPFLLVCFPQALCGFTLYVLLRIWHQLSSFTAIFQTVSFSRTVCFLMIVSWMFGLLVSCHQDTWCCFCFHICKYHWVYIRRLLEDCVHRQETEVVCEWNKHFFLEM